MVLETVILQVETQRDTTISEGAADALIRKAELVITQLSGELTYSASAPYSEANAPLPLVPKIFFSPVNEETLGEISR
jgi:hypothetical protein